MNIFFDTEDNSPELLKSGKSGFGKAVTQIAALTDTGEGFYEAGTACVKLFLRWVRTFDAEETTLWAHNLQYDLGNLFSKSLDGLDLTMVGGRLIRAQWGKYTFKDSFNLWPMRLADVGTAFGLEKGKLDIHSREYVMRDVEILAAAVGFVRDYCQSIGIEGIPSTLGGLTISAWQAETGGENWHDDSPLSRAAFYGGRVELFRAGLQESVEHYDVNSLYPSAMLEGFPADARPIDTVESHGVLDCTIHVPRADWTPLPQRLADGRVVYAYGKQRGVWTTPELRVAMREAGVRILKVHCGLGSPVTCRPYADFIQHCYARRMAAKSEAERLFWKLLMSNLYGRLCVSGNITRSVKLDRFNRDHGTPYGNKVLMDCAMPLPPTTNYMHAAYVTGLGRMLLHKYMRLVDPAAMIYCDTDSIIRLRTGQTLPIGKGIGELKLEGQYDAAVVYAPKCYRFGEKHKAKGVPRGMAKTFLETGRAEFDLPFRMRESIAFFDKLKAEGVTPDARELSVWRKVAKEFGAKYDRKRLTADGRYVAHNIKEFQGGIAPPEY